VAGSTTRPAPPAVATPAKRAPKPTRTVTAPTPEDLDLAKEDALLQLRIGRAAHYYTVLVSAALLLDGALVLLFPPPLTANSVLFANQFFLLIPIFSGLFLAIFALRVKWDEYQLWPWELHFWITFLAVPVNLIAGLAGAGPTATWPLLPALYPLALGGLSLAMAGLALTWTSRSRMQMTSLVAALLPIALTVVLAVPGLSVAQRVNALALSLLASAILYQTSGSFLHLISSGTRAHEREVITSGQTRMFVLADDLRRREQSLELRDAALKEKEIKVEDESLSLKRKLEAQQESRTHLDAIESEIQSRSTSLSEQQATWAAQTAAVATATRAVEEKEADLRRREGELLQQSGSTGEREQRLVAKEGELARREVELARLQEEATQRLKAIGDRDQASEARRLDAERRLTEVLQKESQLRSHTTMAEASAQEQAGTAARLATIESREAALLQTKVELEDLRQQLTAQNQQLREATSALAGREERHASAEAAVASKTLELTQREAAMAATVRLAQSRQEQYEALLRELGDRTKELEGRKTETDQRLADLQRRERDATELEVRLRERERSTAEQQSSLDRRQRERTERLRQDELLAPRPASTPPGPTPAAVAAPTPVAAPTSRRLPDRSSIGSPRLDDLLLGGLPPRGHLLLMGPPFSGKEVLLFQFLAEGLKRGEPVVIVSAGRPPTELAQRLRLVQPDLDARQARGQVSWIDATSTAGDPTAVLSSLVQAARKVEAAHPGPFRVGVLGVGHLFAGLDPARGGAYFQNLVGVLKPRNILCLYELDTGLLPESLLGALQSRVDGVIEFREDRGKPLLAVRGLGEVETRDWIEYKATPQELTLGSFTLERIR
jgi:KaiC/GvpD/RAD55 family RecA-like ATPase